MPARIPGPTGSNIFQNTPGPTGINDAIVTPAFRLGHLSSQRQPGRFERKGIQSPTPEYERGTHGFVATALRSRRLAISGLGAYPIWTLKGAVLFRTSELAIDLDGAPNAYHPPVYPQHWNGKGPGLGRDTLLNAARNWRQLIAGCPPHHTDLHSDIRGGREQAAGHPGPPGGHAQGLCVRTNPGDWAHADWVGIQRNAQGPKIQQQGPYAGFYVPAIVPAWADALVHPWVVLNPRLRDQAGVNLGNSAVVVLNGDPPRVAYAIVADVGNRDKLGEVSVSLLDQLQLNERSVSGKDFIVIMFPAAMDLSPKNVDNITRNATDAFGTWGGLQVIERMFPTPARYLREYNEYHRQLMHLPGGLPHLPPTG